MNFPVIQMKYLRIFPHLGLSLNRNMPVPTFLGCVLMIFLSPLLIPESNAAVQMESVLTYRESENVSDYEEYSRLADEIHEDIISIDTHTDTPLRLSSPSFNIIKYNNPRKNGGKVDFPRMIEGKLDAAYFALYVGQGPRTDSGYKQAFNTIMKRYYLVDSIYNSSENHGARSDLSLESTFIIVKSYDDFNKALRHKKEQPESKQRLVALGIENGYAIGKDISKLKYFYDLGIRYLTLCHTKNNDICDSSTDPAGYEHNGLSDFGKNVVKEMNRLGILVDISHASDKTVSDVIAISKVPVFASHSSSRSLHNESRNLPDSLIIAIANSGGVIQVCNFSGYLIQIERNKVRDSLVSILRKKYNNFQNLPDSIMTKAIEEYYTIDSEYPENLATLSDYVNHIEHIIKLVGIDYVGIGTDFDSGGGVEDCYDVSEMKNITIELLRRGYNKDDISKIWGLNFLRVLKKAEQYTTK